MKLSIEMLVKLLDLPHSPTHASRDLPAATGVSFHSGRVRPGDVFFALPGDATHGIRFADAALAAGAAFVVSDRPHARGVQVPDATAALIALGRHARAQWRAPVVGVTGSAGKTSLKELLAAAMGARASTGNFNTPYALAATLVDGWLAHATDRSLVLEMGIDRPGEMAQLAELVEPDAAVLTLIGPSHLHGLGTVERVAAEKALLLAASPLRFASAQAFGWLPQAMRENTTTYGLSPVAADVSGTVDARSASGQRIGIGGVSIELRHLSRAHAENAVGAFAVATSLGTPTEVAATGIATAPMPPGRLQPRNWGDGLILDDTYNSNPASAAAALEALRSCPRPHVAVLGDMLELGDLSEPLHRELGAATRGLDRVVAFGPESAWIAAANPYAEHHVEWDDLAATLRDLPPQGTVLVKASRGMALERAVDLLLASTAT